MRSDMRLYIMPCYCPMQGYRSKELTKSGKRKIVFSKSQAIDDSKLFQVTIPCGQCIGCRLERSRQWAVRCVHEASLYENNCFITLTFNDENLPLHHSLDVSYFQKFMKRLRKKYGEGIRFFHCGEYGEQYGRPHYHAIIFNFDFADKYLWMVRNDQRLYRSPSLEQLWPFGHSSIGTVTFESAAYVARYIMKKITGEAAEMHYLSNFFDSDTGEVFSKKPEYTTMSRRPGIGKDWFTKFSADVYPGDFVVMNGQKIRPPKYYDTQYELSYPSDFERIKSLRVRNSKKFSDNNTPERLEVRRKVKEAQINKLVRVLD